ncbi:MAG TPA: pilus assembly protein TadG-related protein, partial [Sphingomonas sp.]|nr:pilus assembly protein TadG-related protein [Sphingomonas sp.]
MLAAFSLTAVMGMSGLAVELSTGYATKVRNQRVADMAALGAALSYQSNSSESQATQTARDIIAASGLPAGAATVTLPVTIGSTTGVQVRITTAVPVRLATMISSAATYNVSTSAIASLNGSTSPACVLSLSKTAS